MRMRWLLATLALCALVAFVGSVGPPEATTDQSMHAMSIQQFVTEPAAPAASYAVLRLDAIDNDVGAPVTAISVNHYLHAGDPIQGTKEVVAASAPWVSAYVSSVHAWNGYLRQTIRI